MKNEQSNRGNRRSAKAANPCFADNFGVNQSLVLSIHPYQYRMMKIVTRAKTQPVTDNKNTKNETNSNTIDNADLLYIRKFTKFNRCRD